MSATLRIDLGRLGPLARRRLEAARQAVRSENERLGAAQAALKARHGEDWPRHQHDLLEGGASDNGGQRSRVVTQRLLDRYRQRREIGEQAYLAGLRLFEDWIRAGGNAERAGLLLVRVDGGGRECLTDRQLDYRNRVTRALRAVGPELAPLLVHVCLCDMRAGEWALKSGHPRQAGLAMLCAALSMLGRHYWPNTFRPLTPE